MADILIIGGGVIGLTSAYVFAKEGLQVTLVDRQDFGQEASWAGAGIIPPGNLAQAVSPFDRLRSLSSSLFPDFSAHLRQYTSIDNGYVRCGGLEFSEAKSATLPEEWRGTGIETELLAESQSRQLEPALAAGLGEAVRLPALAQVRNPRHVKALIAACGKVGVTLKPNCAARHWLHQGDMVQGIRAGDEAFHADSYLVTAGAWTDSLLIDLGCNLGIKPVRGQIALLDVGSPVFHHVLLWGDRYLVPRQDGKVLIGSTEEHAGYDKRTTASAQQELLAFACHLVPALGDASLERTWAGLRPGSPDGLPFIGPVLGYANVFIAAGHFRAGIQLSLGTARLLKEMVLRQPLTIPAEPFRLDRNCGAG